MVITDYWKLKESDKLTFLEKNENCRCDEDKLVYVVFPRRNKVYPMYINMDMLHQEITMVCMAMSFSSNLEKKYGTEYLAYNNFYRTIHFDEYQNIVVQGVDKLKIFNEYHEAVDFVNVKTDKDFIPVDDKGHYLFTEKQALELIAKLLETKPSMLKIVK